MFAIIETGGKQFKVEEGKTLQVEKLEEEEGASIKIDKVLLINDKGETTIGRPYIKGASVSAKVVEQGKGDKIIVFKMKAKKRYQKTQGHRQLFTTIEIVDIKASGSKSESAPKSEAKEAKSEAAPKKVAKKPTAKKA